VAVCHTRFVADSLDGLLTESIDMAKAAGALTLEYFGRSDIQIDAKPDGTEVTDADRRAEALIREMIELHHPADAILGEEHGSIPGSSGRTWIIDPIDGTFGFVRGVPLYATLIAVIDQDGPAVGVIHLPALGKTVAAARGLGCTYNGSACEVGGTSTVKGSLVCTSDWSAASQAQLIGLRSAGAHMRTWGDAYGYAMVATGDAEAMVDPICNAWDLAPIPVIIGEAGGRFSALDGSSGFDRGHGMATNGALHDELLAIMRVDADE
jgi:histidinol-phosphatase